MESIDQSAKESLDQAFEDAIEIPDELLEAVTGGLGSGEAIDIYKNMMRTKKDGKSPEKFLEELKNGEIAGLGSFLDERLEEVKLLVSRFW